MSKHHDQLIMVRKKEFENLTTEIEMKKEIKKMETGGFKNLGELVHSAAFRGKKSVNEDPRVLNLASNDVGVLIPEQFASDLLQVNSSEIVYPRSINIPAGNTPDAKYTIGSLKEIEGILGGMTLEWVSERGTIPQTEPELSDVTLQPRFLCGIIVINNKTLANWAANEMIIKKIFQGALAAIRDREFLYGDGVGRPLGIKNAPGAVRITRNTASTIIYRDLVSMVSRFHGNAGEWVVSPETLGDLYNMVDANGSLIYKGGDLLNYPVRVSASAPARGNEGDIMLIDAGYYLVKQGSGPIMAISGHTRFSQNQTSILLGSYFDGQPWVSEPLTLSTGTKVSPFVVLA